MFSWSWAGKVLFYFIKIFLAIKPYEASLPSKWLGEELFKYPQASIFSLSLPFQNLGWQVVLCSNCKNKVNPKLKISCYIPFLFTWLGLGTQTYMRLSVILRSKLNKTVINIGWVRLSPKQWSFPLKYCCAQCGL